MASKKTAFFAVFLFATLSLFSPSSGVREDSLMAICSQTQSEEFCENLLMNDPRTSSADLPLLSLISIELTEKQANQTLQILSQLHHNATDPSIKDPLDTCLGIYSEIEGKIKEAHQLSVAKRYKDIDQLAKATDLAIQCEKGIPLSYNATLETSTNMILTCQTSTYVNLFVTRSM